MSHKQQIYDKERIHLNLARIKKGGKTFEVVLENIDKAISFRNGENEKIREIMQGDLILSDAKKGKKASEEDMEKWLGTENHFEAAKIIIKKGELQITKKQREKILKSKENKILNYIQRNACDPKTNLPIPLKRIKLGMEQAKIKVDATDKVDFQIKKIISALRPILPMSFEKIELIATIPAEYASHAYSIIKSKYNISNEKWNNNGSVNLKAKIVAGEKEKMYSLLNKLTSGEVKIEEKK